MKFTVQTEHQMAALAHKFSEAIILPLIVGVNGYLGVGKTAFIRSLIRVYKIDEKVKSPTFSMVEEYNYSDIEITHADLYRVKRDERNYIDFCDYYSKNSLIIIEWIENDKSLMKKSDIIIDIEILKNTNMRHVSFTGNSGKGKQLIQNIR
jgi:tRNA threonylcarbamoyladenosine biosynthesis protein TsaE